MKNPAVKAGQTVRIVETFHEGYAYLNGAEITIERDTENSLIHVPGKGYVTCNEWELVVPEEPINRYTMPDSTADMAAEIERLKRELEHEKAQHKLSLDLIVAMRRDFACVSDNLLNEATDRDWCEDYDNFVDATNAELKVFALAKPDVEYDVVVQRIRTVYEQATVTVRGRRNSTERDLRDAAFEEAWNAYDWDQVDDDVSDEYEIVDVNEA